MKTKLLFLSLVWLAIGGSLYAQSNTARMLAGVNPQTACTGPSPYTLQPTDTTLLVTFNTSAACSVILPNPTTAGYGAGAIFSIKNDSATYNVTIFPTGTTISGASSLVLTPGQGADIYSSGSSYEVQQGSGVGAASTTPGGSNLAVQYNNSGAFGGIPNGLTGQIMTFTNGVAGGAQSPGIIASVNSPVSTTPYTIACDSGTAIIDRAHTLHFNSGSGTITVPLSTATGCTGGFSTILYDDTGNLTVNATSADTFNIYSSGALLTGQTTFTLYKGQVATLDQDFTGIWSIRLRGPFSTLTSTTNCAANGTAANPSVVSCSAAAAGMFSCSTSASTGTCQVNTSAVTANSEIFITQDQADGGASQLNVTCNTTNVLNTSKPLLVSKSAGVSFTINLGTVSTNPACFEYHIVN